MSLEENKLLVRHYYEKVVNTGNVDLIERFIRGLSAAGVSQGRG